MRCSAGIQAIRIWVLNHADSRWRVAIGLAVYAGLRQGEILALRWDDIDWVNCRISVRWNLQRAAKAKIAGVSELFSSPKRIAVSGSSPYDPYYANCSSGTGPTGRRTRLAFCSLR
jgi:integrase